MNWLILHTIDILIEHQGLIRRKKNCHNFKDDNNDGGKNQGVGNISETEIFLVCLCDSLEKNSSLERTTIN